MVKAVKGTLIETDPSVKEIIQMFTAEENVVIEDINDRMLFIDTAFKEEITEKVEKILQNYIKKNE